MPAFLAASPAVKLLGVDISKQLVNAAKGIPLVGGILAKNKNPGRMNANTVWLQRALQGDPAAISSLKYRSGRYGNGPVENALGGPIVTGGKWGDQKAADDAYAKYQQVVSANPVAAAMPLAPQLPPTFQIPNLPNLTDVLPAPVQDGVQKVATAVGTTSSTVAWVALIVGAALAVRALRQS